MLALVMIYSILTAVAAVLHLTKAQYVPAVLVLFMAAAAYIGGREFYTALIRRGFFRKIGRLVYGLLLMALSIYLSGNAVNLYYYAVPGLWWAVAGIVLGLVSTSIALIPRGR